MKRYKEYKDSGVEWIGEIPSHWEVKRVKEFSKITQGYPFSSDKFNTEDKGYPIIRIRNLKNNLIDTYYDGGIVKNVIIKDNDILIGMDGDFNLSVWNSGFALLNQRVCKIDTLNIDKEYFKYLLDIPLKIINDLTYFTTVKHLSIYDVEKIMIPMPNIEEQNKIANYLDKKTSQIDNLISKKEELIETLKASRTKLISETVTKGLDKNTPMKDSGIEWIGEIPSHWSAKRLKNIANMFGGNAFDSSLFSDEGVQIIRIGNLYQNKLSLERQPIYCPYEKINSYKKYIITKGDILMSLTGTLGKRDYGFAILIEENEQFLLNQRVAKITHGKDVYNRYLLYILWSNSYLNQLFSKPSGTKQGNLSNEEILSIYIAFTEDLGEQKRIADYLDEKTSKIDILISKIEKQIELLKKAKQKLITEVVTGKIDVTNL